MLNLQKRMAENNEAPLIEAARKNCVMCMGRSRLRNTDKEKQAALDAVKELKHLFEKQYNHLRKVDADSGSIQKALQNKRKCMDAIDACNGCDKQVDRINRALRGLK